MASGDDGAAFVARFFFFFLTAGFFFFFGAAAAAAIFVLSADFSFLAGGALRDLGPSIVRFGLF